MTYPLHRFAPPPRPRIFQRHRQQPVKVADAAPNTFNGRVALLVTNAVGTMWCAYAFGVLALIALPQAISGGVLSIIQWVSQTFLQLVLLSVIMVGQNLQGTASDKRAEDTWTDASETLHRTEQIQDRLDAQDAHLADQDRQLAQIIAALSVASLEQSSDASETRP